MDELEILKQDWKKKEHSFEQLTETDIYKMLHKKSSSIVKWLFYISIGELLLWVTLSLLPIGDDNFEEQNVYLQIGTLIFEVISYGILIYFITRFYLNYKKISATQSVKGLIETILNSRKTVNTYIKIVMAYTLGCFLFLIISSIAFSLEEGAITEKLSNIHEGKQFFGVFILILLAIVTITIIIGILWGIMWLFYKLLYGILLKRLTKNYEELKKLDL